MPGAIGAMVLPSLLSGTSLMTALGGAGPLITGALGGGLGNALAGEDFWKGTLGGLAGGALNMAMPGLNQAFSGLGSMAPVASNALRGAVMSGVGGGNPLQGALGGGLVGGLMNTQTGQGLMSQGANALRSMSGLQPAAEQTMGGNFANAFGGDAGLANQMMAASMGQDPMQQVNMAGWGNPQQAVAGGFGDYLKGFMKPEVIVPAAAQFGMAAYQGKMAEDMADRQEKLAREMDTGLGLRKQAAGYAMDPNSIPGSPGYQAALNERRRQLNRLASARGMLNSGQLPAQLAGAAEQQMGDWYRYYSDTANRGGSVPYPNYQNMLRTM